METKIRCTRCGKEKPASDYARKNGNGKILVKSCKACIDKNSGALNLWYELQQIDAIIEQAAKDIADELQNALADTEIYFGKF